MKKGIVLEHHRNYSIIVTRDGSFEKVVVLEKNAAVGAEVSYKPYKGQLFSLKRINVPIKTLSMVCIVLLLLLPLYFLVGKQKTYAYVTVDINPSIEMEIDKDFNVRHIKALNDDASIILDNMADTENKNIETIIDKIINKSEHTGLTNAEKNMIVGISYTDAHSGQEEFFTGNLKNYLSTVPGWEIAAFIVPEKIREQAIDKDISMNKVMAREIMEKNSDSIEEATIDSNDKAIINSFYNMNTESNENKGSSSKTNDEELIIPLVTEQGSKINQNKSNSIEEDKQIENNEKRIKHEQKDLHPKDLKGENGKINSNSNYPSSKNHAQGKNKNEKTKPRNVEIDKEKKNKDNNDWVEHKAKKRNGNNGKGNNKHKKNNSNHSHGYKQSKSKEKAHQPSEKSNDYGNNNRGHGNN